MSLCLPPAVLNFLSDQLSWRTLSRPKGTALPSRVRMKSWGGGEKRAVHQPIMTNPSTIKGRALLINRALQEEGGAKWISPRLWWDKCALRSCHSNRSLLSKMLIISTKGSPLRLEHLPLRPSLLLADLKYLALTTYSASLLPWTKGWPSLLRELKWIVGDSRQI